MTLNEVIGKGFQYTRKTWIEAYKCCGGELRLLIDALLPHEIWNGLLSEEDLNAEDWVPIRVEVQK